MTTLYTGSALVDMGTIPGTGEGTFSVTGQANIQADDIVRAWIRPSATTDHSADEHRVEEFVVTAGNISPGVGFDITIMPVSEQSYGLWSVAWSWQAKSQ